MENQLNNTPPIIQTPAPQPTTQPPVPNQKPTGSNKGLLIIGGIVLLVIIAGGLFFLFNKGQKSPTPVPNSEAQAMKSNITSK